MLQKLGYWLPLAIVSTTFCGLTYIVSQQILRQGANDPQIQLSEDIASQLTAGENIYSVVPANMVNLEKSLAPFIIVFDDKGEIVATNAKLDGQMPEVPKGVIEFAKKYGQNRLTWQPKPGVRQAVVLTRYEGQNSGVVLTGRSLREVEKRVGMLMTEIVVVWGITLATTFFACLLLIRAKR